jgi:Domain of unknown function (DUF4388)
MMKPRGTFAEKLADVLQVLQLARKTGLLVIEREGGGEAVEQGTVTLQNGQITDASYGRYRGSTALDILMGWRPCYFVLHPPSATAASSAFSQQNSSGRQPGSRPSGMLPPPVPSAPYRTQQVDVVLPYFARMGLSRAHRQLFLLVDGQRPLTELIRLMGRGPDEVEALLADLAGAGLIHL